MHWFFFRVFRTNLHHLNKRICTHTKQSRWAENQLLYLFAFLVCSQYCITWADMTNILGCRSKKPALHGLMLEKIDAVHRVRAIAFECDWTYNATIIKSGINIVTTSSFRYARINVSFSPVLSVMRLPSFANLPLKFIVLIRLSVDSANFTQHWLSHYHSLLLWKTNFHPNIQTHFKRARKKCQKTIRIELVPFFLRKACCRLF